MNVKVYSNTKKFWDEISPQLRQEEAKNSLILGLCHHFTSQPTDCYYQSALFDGDQCVAVLVGSLYRSQLNCLVSPLAKPEHAQLLFAEFMKGRPPVQSLIGEVKSAEIYKALFEKQSYNFRIHMSQGIYRCSKVNMPKIPEDVNVRLATAKDVEIIATWIGEFHAEAIPHDPLGDFKQLAETRISKKMIYILEQSGIPASIAAWSRDIGTSCSVNLVYTPVKFRRNGYGSMVTAFVTQMCLDSGKNETNLYTDMGNETSNRIYQQIGYQLVCHSVHYGVI